MFACICLDMANVVCGDQPENLVKITLESGWKQKPAHYLKEDRAFYILSQVSKGPGPALQ